MNQRETGHPRGCCDPTGLGELRRSQTRTARHKAGRRQQSGCLDQCELGPTVAVYPEGVFYGGVRPEDLDEIIESHIVKGQPVERLRIPTEFLNAPHKKDGA